ncbi:hypothetical protein BSZ32_01065 [Rubritalea profundi]|uniref:Uncharacterized protein n=1 Tax=Rubritalea profundi TaxID=1658618 RepID=A0A2S7TZ19_9BACT|nr:hypothetical protein BSZ32_01065 [Rubritalea profundi]
MIERTLPKVVGIEEDDDTTGDPFAEQNSEQGDADEPAPGPESKPEGDDKPKLESEVCPQ